MLTRRPFLVLLSLSCVCFALLFAVPNRAQSPAISAAATTTAPTATPQITQPIDSNDLVTLRGNAHPLALPQYDQGPLPDAAPLHRMLLLLQRSPQSEQALQKFLGDQQSKSSPNYHIWLTPEQFGAQYGPAPADVQTVSSWLLAQGFTINRLSAGRTIIEFNGTVGQVRNAFHTQIHRYLIAGEEHTANSSDPQIPAALAPVVAGIVSLHNFPAQSHLLKVGAFRRSRKAGTIEPLAAPLANPSAKPLYDPPNYPGQYLLVPGDFATIYNVAPLWKAGIDGTGQSIAIVGETDIDVADIQNFRALFGLSNNFTSANVIVDGVDPGINGDETEADLDIEWSGAVAKNATITFVTSAATEVSLGTDLSALYVVDHNAASVLSESYGQCETYLGSAGNQFYNAMWEQAAAQGITAVVSAGDGGSAGCDDFDTQPTAILGLGINGYASTAFNVAVGGTDFNQINNWSQFWSSTNDPVTLASALGYIPEIPWNNSCAQLGLGGCGSSQPGGDFLNIVAGSGGVSNLYAKPSWQSGTGVPQDNKRDIPDVSFMASNNFAGSSYLICESDFGADCQAASGSFNFLGVGGTSASAPSFAGIMALINQSQAKQGASNRQGNANYVLYALAKQQGNVTPALNCNASAPPAAACTFNDITGGNTFYTGSGVGNNSVPCTGDTPGCSSKVASVNGILIVPTTSTTQTPAYTTNTGYDLATGLGSVNVQNLASNWKSANSVGTTTTLALNVGAAVNITHGAPVSVSVGVTPKAAVGDVSLVATFPPSPGSPSGRTLGMAQFTLASGVASGTTSNLAGGAYTVTAHYEGDGTNAPSDSPGVSVTVAPEASNTFFTVPTFNPNTGKELSNTPSTLVYGSSYIIRADVTNSTGSLAKLCYTTNILSCPSGTVAITDSINGAAAQPLDAGTFALNSAGYAEDQTVQLMGGSHMLSAQYSGDNSYTKSSSSPYALTVMPAPSTLAFNPTFNSAIVGQNIYLSVQMENSVKNGATPGGTVTFLDGSTPLPGNVSVVAYPGSPYTNAMLTAALNTSLSTAGSHTITAKYSGDANYAQSSASLNVTAYYATTLALSVNPQTVVYGSTVTATAVLNTNVKTPAPSGSVSFLTNIDGPISSSYTQTSGTDANGNAQVTASVTFKPQETEGITATYNGDSNFISTQSAGVAINVNTPDFALVAPSPIVVTAGQTGTTTLVITPASNLSSTVLLTCSSGLPAGSTCSFNPSSVNLTNGSNGSSILSVTSMGPSSSSGTAAAVARRAGIIGWFGMAVRTFPRALRTLEKFVLLASIFALGFVGIYLLFSLVLRQRRFALRNGFYAAALGCVMGLALGCGGGGGGGGITPPQMAITTTVLSSPAPKVAAGTMATFTATVSSSKSPTGTVTFFVNGGAFSGPVPLVAGSAQAQTTLPYPGAWAITAQYSGDANNDPSTAATFYGVATGSTVIVVNAQTGVNNHQATLSFTIQ